MEIELPWRVCFCGLFECSCLFSLLIATHTATVHKTCNYLHSFYLFFFSLFCAFLRQILIMYLGTSGCSCCLRSKEITEVCYQALKYVNLFSACAFTLELQWVCLGAHIKDFEIFFHISYKTNNIFGRQKGI